MKFNGWKAFFYLLWIVFVFIFAFGVKYIPQDWHFCYGTWAGCAELGCLILAGEMD